MKNEESVEIISKFIKSDLRKYIELLIYDNNFIEDIEKSKIFKASSLYSFLPNIGKAFPVIRKNLPFSIAVFKDF